MGSDSRHGPSGLPRKAIAPSRAGRGLGLGIPLACAVLACLAALPPWASAEGQEPADDLPAARDAAGEGAGETVRCPDCDAAGRMRCPDCGGKGEIHQLCQICRGGGRKPCPVCAEGERKVSERGRLRCDYCGGKGTVGAAGRSCPQCGGTQSVGCTTCGSKGTVNCRKQVYEKVCPRCRFAGKVPCTTCDETTQVSPAMIAARRASPPGAKAMTGAFARSGEDEDGRSPPTGSRESDEEGEPELRLVSAAEISSRYKKLAEIHGAHLDVFGDDYLLRAEPLRKDAADASKQIKAARGVEAGLLLEVDAVLARLKSFRERWTELREVFDDEHRSFQRVLNAWEARESRIAEAPAWQRDEVEGEQNGRIDILLRLAERHAARLAGEEPGWIPREVSALEAAWPPLKEKAAQAVAAAAGAEAAERTALAAKKAAAKRLAQKAQAAASSAQRVRSHAASEPASRTADERPPPRSAARSRAAEGEGAAGRPVHREARAAARSLAFPLACGVLGFGAASLVFWLTAQSRRRQEPRAREGAPRAVC